MTEQLDLESYIAKQARDAALAQVAENAEGFIPLALREIRRMRGEVTGEAIRMNLERLGYAPHHNNAWGALINTAVRRGYLKDTGKMAHMKAKRSHARRTPVYEVIA